MDIPTQFYTSQIEIHQSKIDSFKLKLTLYSLARVLVYLLGVMGIYMYFLQWQIVIAITVVSVTLFLILVSNHSNLKAKRDLFKALLKINKDELEIASGNFHDRFKGLQFQDPNHFYSLDIDLFGRGSLFQYMNRTAIDEGTFSLANALTANNIDTIDQRQEAIKELALLPKWRQLYTAKASLVETETPAKIIIDWLKSYKRFLPNMMKWFPMVFGFASVLIIVLGITKIIPIEYIGYWLLVGLGITAGYLKKVNTLSMHTSKVKDTFRQYAQLLDQIELENFNSELLKSKQLQIRSNDIKASEIFKSLSKSLDALDNRNNMFSIFLGNGFLLWDLMQSYKIEKWIETYADKVEDWFEVVSFFDAYNSLGNFSFNHPQYVFPEITKNETTLNAEQLGHPLLDVSKRIDSDVTIVNEQFFIVTGANMAGKSTFLRTISLHIVMANSGLPVCAKSSQYSPVKLITSMRTTDSLTDDSSYFFSELTRLKFIVDAIQTEPYFIILDEILKGTNSTDKAIGSRKFVERLVGGNATGIIATHDLSLCEIEVELDDVENHYFDAEIINDELYFDYKFKKGICQNMNASFLLKKMEIV